jgi:hypothetical protein
MKSSAPNARPQNTPKQGPVNNNKQRPEIRDNLDSREGEEQQTKGDDITHNKKETKVNHLKEKKNR